MSFVLCLYSERWGAGESLVYNTYTDELNSLLSAESYARNIRWTTAVVFNVEGVLTNATSRAAKDAIRRIWLNNTDPTTSAWCVQGGQLPAGFTYVGKYYPATRRGRIIEERAYDCPHCALVAAKSILAARGQNLTPAVILSVAGETEIPERLTAATGTIEVVGESKPETTATIRDYTGTPGLACNNCGRLNHTSRTCQLPAHFFDKIGVEVEGRFNNLGQLQRTATNMQATYSGDASIHESPDSAAEPYEFKTHPGNLRHTIEQVVALYPDETDKSCGMHIHMSFPQDCLTLLNTTAFFEYFEKRWRAWGTAMALHPQGEFFKRLEGDNDYCSPNEFPRTYMYEGERYEQLNFTAWTGHKTIECRLLPMFRRSSLAVAAIQELVSIYEDFLADPLAHGVVMPDFRDVGIDTGFLVADKVTDSFELAVPQSFAFTSRVELELEELPPPAANMVRITLPVNQPITVEALTGRLRALRAA